MTLAEVARRRPRTIDVFEEAGIDYSCKGARSLADAAADAGLSPSDLIGRLCAAAGRDADDRDWQNQSLVRLVRGLIEDHEVSIRASMPAVEHTIEEAIASHSANEDLIRLRRLFSHFAADVAAHMLNEERDLFPCIERLEAAHHTLSAAPNIRIGQRVLGELIEHDRFREQLRTMRELALGVQLAEGTGTIAAELQRFSREVHRHMHIENNVLYPRAIALENELRRGGGAEEGSERQR